MKSIKILKFLLCLFVLTIGYNVVQAEPAVFDYFKDHSGATLMVSPLVITFAKDIQENLYPDNAFYKNSINDSIWIDGATVRLPQAGAAPNVVKNRSTLPALISQRADSAEEYAIDEYTTDPIVVQDTEEMQLSYQKRASILYNKKLALQTAIADAFGGIWLPNGVTGMVRTSGVAAPATATGATGNRLAVTYNDWVDAVTLLDRMDVPAEGRFAVVPATLYAQLLKIDKFIDYQNRGLVDLLSKGYIGEINGVKIFKRSRTGLYDNTATPVKKAQGAAAATTDNEAIMIWSSMFVRRAEGDVKVYEGIDKPEYYGSVFSAKVNAGGRIARTDEKGVVAIIQHT